MAKTHGERLINILLGATVEREEKAFDVVGVGEVEVVAGDHRDELLGDDKFALAQELFFADFVGGREGIAGFVDVGVHLVDPLAVVWVITIEAGLLVVQGGHELPVNAVLSSASVLDGLFVDRDVGLEQGDLAVGENLVASVVSIIAVEAAGGAGGATYGVANQFGE